MGDWLRRLGPFLWLGLGLGLVLLFGYQAAVKPLGQTALDGGSKEVQGSTTVGQTFVAPFDGLYRVDVFLSPSGGTDKGDVLFHVRTAPDAGEDLRSGVVNASNVKSAGWFQIEFAPISDSGGKGYYFLLESPSSTPGDTFSASRSSLDRYRDGVYYLDGAPSDGDLAFQIHSQPGLISWMQGLCRLLAQDKPSIWGDPAFYGALFVGYVGLLAAAVRLLLHEGPEEEIL
jgi:hypothetical protein